MTEQHAPITNYLTIDVEDYFHVSAFENIVSIHDWPRLPSRIEANVHNILEILDSRAVKATFFVLGWIAEKHPALIKTIAARGHRIACHSYAHRLIYRLTPRQFLADTKLAKDLLENLLGEKICGYRAPSYSITRQSLWALDILEELGFSYDSSIFPIYHDRYGMPEAPRFAHRLPGRRLVEYPISTCKVLGQKVPVSGGGYFRLFPYWLVRKALRHINHAEGKPFVFYLHPWEIDPEQPRFDKAGAKSRFRHYLNLDKTEKRFARLLDDFSFAPIT